MSVSLLFNYGKATRPTKLKFGMNFAEIPSIPHNRIVNFNLLLSRDEKYGERDSDLPD